MNLSGLFGLRERKYFSEAELLDRHEDSRESKVFFKPVIRSSNSVYYPNILSSIYLPSIDELNENTINLIKESS